MPMVRAMRMLNAIEAGTLSGSQLETLLTTDAGRLAELNVLLGLRGQCRRLAASSTAMAAVVASATAMAAVAASATAMAAVAASNTASDAVFTSATARLAIYNSDTALAAYQANPTQVQRQIDTAGRTVTVTAPATQPHTILANGTRAILLRRWYPSSEVDAISWGRGQTAFGAGNGPSGGGRNLATASGAAMGATTAYTSSGSAPTASNANANFVSAANGLVRYDVGGNWWGVVLNVTYILV